MDSMVFTTEEEILAIRRFDRWCRANGLKEFNPHIGLPSVTCLSCSCYSCMEDSTYLMEIDEVIRHNRRVTSMNPTMTNDLIDAQTEKSLVRAEELYQFLAVINNLIDVESSAMWSTLLHFHRVQATPFQKKLVVKVLGLIAGKQDEVQLKNEIRKKVANSSNNSEDMLVNALGETRIRLEINLTNLYIEANKQMRSNI
jgi:hypothetical protein